jgi:hypothetical protein
MSKQKPRVMNPGPLNEFWVEAASDAECDREPLKRRRGESTSPELFAQSQTADGLTVTRNVVLAQVCKQAAPLTHHLQKSTARMMILPIGAKVIGQLRDPLGQKRNLHFRRSGIRLMSAKLCDNFVLAICLQRHPAYTSCTNAPLPEARMRQKSMTTRKEYHNDRPSSPF